MTLVSVHTTGTLKKGMLKSTMWSIPTPSAYVSQIPRLFMTRVFGFTSLCATPTFILVCEQKEDTYMHSLNNIHFCATLPWKCQIYKQINVMPAEDSRSASYTHFYMLYLLFEEANDTTQALCPPCSVVRKNTLCNLITLCPLAHFQLS